MTTTTSSPSTVIAVAEHVFTNTERLALAGFLAGYTGLTRQAYALDLRQYTSWCQQHHLHLFQARRAMSGGRGWTTNLMPPAWTVTNSPRSWSQPGSARQGSMR